MFFFSILTELRCNLLLSKIPILSRNNFARVKRRPVSITKLSPVTDVTAAAEDDDDDNDMTLMPVNCQ